MIYRWDFPQKERSDRDLIMTLVCAEFKCTVDELKGKRSTRNINDARKVYAYFCRKFLNDTLIRIGMELNRTHSNIIHGLSELDGWITINDLIVPKLKRIESEFLKTKNK